MGKKQGVCGAGTPQLNFSAAYQAPLSLLPLPPPLHPKQLALGVIFSLFGSDTNSFQERREKKGTRSCCTTLSCTLCGLCPSPTNTHTNIPYRHWDVQQSGSAYAHDPISLHTDRQDMSKPVAWKEVKLWANVPENEFQKVLSSLQFIDT